AGCAHRPAAPARSARRGARRVPPSDPRRAGGVQRRPRPVPAPHPVRMLSAALALVLAGCAAPPLERPSFTPTDAGRIAVPVSRDETLTGTLTLPGAGSPVPAVV